MDTDSLTLAYDPDPVESAGDTASDTGTRVELPGEDIDLRDAIENDPAENDYVIHGFLAGTVAAMVGAGGSSKTTLGGQIAFGVAAGIRADIAGCFIPQADWPTGRVLVGFAEDPLPILRRRFHMLGRRLSHCPEVLEAVYERVRLRSLYGQQTHLVCMTQNGPEVNSALYESLCTACMDTRLLIIDPLRRWHNCDENSSGQMTVVLNTFERITYETGCSVLFMHHQNQSSIRNGGDEQTAGRGSTAITDNVRCQINLVVMRPDEEKTYRVKPGTCKDYVRVRSAKINYAGDFEHWLHRVRELEGVLEPANVGRQDAPPANMRQKGGQIPTNNNPNKEVPDDSDFF